MTAIAESCQISTINRLRDTVNKNDISNSDNMARTVLVCRKDPMSDVCIEYNGKHGKPDRKENLLGLNSRQQV